MGSGRWGAVAAAMVCSGGCAQSHPPAGGLPPAELQGAKGEMEAEDASSPASPEDSVSFLTRCGVPDPERPALLGTDGSELWMGWLDGRQVRVHPFDAEDPASSPGLEPTLHVTGGHLLVSIGGQSTQQGVRPRSDALLTLDGELLWTRSWSAGEGGEVAAFGADGSVLLRSEGRYVWLQPDASEQPLAAGFIPLDTPDADGWMPGMFSQADGSTIQGFQQIATDERRLLAGATRGDLRELGSQDLIDGRFYYIAVDTVGIVSLEVEGPDSQATLVLDGVSELPYLTPGPTHTLVHVGTRPIALLERATLKLTRVGAAGRTSADAEDGRQLYLQADGDWFVVTAQSTDAWLDAAHPYHTTPMERLYRIHAPTGRLDVEPAVPLPEGLARSSYSVCGRGASGQSVNGQLVQGLAPLDDDPPLVQMYLEGPDDDAGWTTLGNPIAFAMGPRAVQVGETWLLQSGDVRNSYCGYPHIDDPSALGPEVLIGRSVQVVAPDGEILAFDGEDESFGDREDEISLSADGSCALIYSAGRTWIHDLLTHAEQDVDLPNARWLRDFGETP